ncbi:MAG: polysaccharide deacetylase family protein [Bacteroidota bacterium]|nr:polysaccharide deacetylase family protein [Bacteroidota bacterium]
MLILYSHNITPRLHYIIDFIAKEFKVDPFQLTSSAEEFNNYAGGKVNYSEKKISDREIWIKPHDLLFEKGIKEQNIECFEINGNKAFFKTGGDYPFDIFAASFYLLSRYEEYLPHTKDMYGRYAYENSLACKEGFLHLPLVNIWLRDFETLLKQKFPGLTTHRPPLTFLPTYDIDIAWSYKHKGWQRNLGGLFRSLVKGEWSLIKERISVLRGKQKDPFDAFGWMNHLHEQYKVKPYYFFLIPEKRGRYDKNIPPSCKAMQELIRDHVIRYPVGIHPSWKSGDDVLLLKKEIETLSTFTGSSVVSSRQHYVRFNLPDGYRRLIDTGIQFDFSMGYGSINGFRASVASPFYWYDLEKERQTGLMVFSFCQMDANSFYEQKLTAGQTLEEMRRYYNIVKSVNGYFIMLWHNSFLGTDRLYAGWRDIYEQFIREVGAD